MVPLIDVVPLLGAAGRERDRADQEIASAAHNTGLFTIAGPSEIVPTAQANREALLAVFGLAPHVQRTLWRNFYDKSHPSVYRGWSPRSSDVGVDIYDMGSDVVPGRSNHADEDDPLLGTTPTPEHSEIPGWHEAVASYFVSMERLGAAIMCSIARVLGIDEHHFDDAFHDGISTLRLLRYELPPVDPADDLELTDRGMPRRGEHVDSGFVTLLCQHGVAGLSAKLRNGEWVEVPPTDGHLTVNFGGLLERWTEGRIRATPHRVVSEGHTRCSIPFFYEPRADAVIEPLPIPGAASFEPFSYGDHLWKAMSKFPNFTGISDLRTPRGVTLQQEIFRRRPQSLSH